MFDEQSRNTKKSFYLMPRKGKMLHTDNQINNSLEIIIRN